MPFFKHMRCVMMILCCTLVSLMAAEKTTSPYTFGVLAQRSAVLTAQYWNPILTYVSAKSGVSLVLKVERTAPASNVAIQHGNYDFVYANTIFHPDMDSANYQVILRPRDHVIKGQIVTLTNSPLYSLQDIANTEVGFPSITAFLGYVVPMDYLRHQSINVIPVFGGNQEGIIAQLKAGKVLVAAVKSQIMSTYAHRENITYRVLWESEEFFNIPIAVHPRIPKDVAQAVQNAFETMSSDPEGLKILEASAKRVVQDPPLGFTRSSSAEYQNYRDFYTHLVREEMKKP